MKESIVFDKSKNFALRIIALYKYLCAEKKEFVLSKQVLRILLKQTVLAVTKIFLQKCILHLKSVQKLPTGWNFYIKHNI